MASSSRIDLAPLTSTTKFNLWQVKMESILISLDLEEAILGVDKITGTNDVEKKKKDAKALAQVRLHLSNEILQQVIKEKTTKNLWEKLESLLMTKTPATRLYAKARLYSHRMEGKSLKTYLEEFREIINDLENLGVKTDDEDLAMLLLYHLPSKYTHFRDTLLYGKQTITLDEVMTSLLSKDKMDSSQKENSGEGLYTRGRSIERGKTENSRPRSKSQHKNLICNYCKKKGHIKKNCFKLQNKLKSGGVNPKEDDSGNANIATDQSDFALFAEENSTALLVAKGLEERREEWTIDSACSFHITPHKHWFNLFNPVSEGVVFMGNENSCKIEGIGTVQIRTRDGLVRTLSDVRYVPDMKRNLISLSALEDKGCSFSGRGGVLKISHGQLVMLKGIRKGNLYILEGDTVVGHAAVVETTDDTKLWHMRLGHMSDRGLIELSNRGSFGKCKISKVGFCDHCLFGKQKRVTFITPAMHVTKGILDYIHADVWGPSREASLSGARYMVTFIDDFSRKVWVYFLKHKSEAFDAFKSWKVMIEKQTEREIKKLRTDNGLEFCSGAFNQFCKEEGIVRHLTVPGTPQQNGVAERMNRTLLEKARCMLSNSGLRKRFWAEAINTACFITNRSPHSSLNMTTPEERWSGKAADYNSLKIFGCPAYAHVSNGKLDPRSVKCIFLGYSPGVKGYRLWNPHTSKIIVSRNVIFDESSLVNRGQDIAANAGPNDDFTAPEDNQPAASEHFQVELQLVPFSAQSQSTAAAAPNAEQFSAGTDEIQQSNQQSNQLLSSSGAVGVSDTAATRVSSAQVQVPSVTGAPVQTIDATRPRRNITAPKRLIEESNFVGFALAAASEIDNGTDPQSYHQAVSCFDSEKWLVAMQEEMQALQENNTWKLTKLPPGKHAIKCKWVYKKKEGIPAIEDPRYKARLVAKGFSQIPGIDFTDIFSPVVKQTSIRLILGMVAQNDLELEQLDVKMAFLHGDLDEEIYMEQPEGYYIDGKRDYVCKLEKSLYGLKQSPRQWYKRFDQFITSIGFERSNFDACVYIKRCGHSFMYLLLYVDDMLIAAKNMSDIDKLKVKLKTEFQMKDLGAAKKILGMEISRDRKESKLYLSQEGYILKVLERFGMSKAKSVTTPLGAHFKLTRQMSPSSEKEADEMANVPYASAVGSLMYAMVCTRPDLAHAISVVSRFMANPGKEHWQAVKWILRYLKGTISKQLEFSNSSTGLVGYVDSDYAGCLDSRRSTSGYVFTFGGCAMSWRSRLQDCVALSTAEAEYMAITDAVKEAIWLRNLYGELTQDVQKLNILCDSQSAIYLTKDGMFHERTKHIDVRYHKVREVIAEGDIIVKKVDTTNNAADMLTKVLPVTKFEHCLDLVKVTH